MDIQMPNKMDMKQQRDSLIVLWVPNSNCGLTAGIMIDENVLSQE
jgi:hypothetical protein